MGARVPQLGSFHYALKQKSKERLLLPSNLKDVEWGYLQCDGFEDDRSYCFGCRRRLRRMVEGVKSLWAAARKVWEFGCSDPRKPIFGVKMGMALSIISLLIFFKEPLPDISRNSIWAVLTVVLIFEFSIGNFLLLILSVLPCCIASDPCTERHFAD